MAFARSAPFPTWGYHLGAQGLTLLQNLLDWGAGTYSQEPRICPHRDRQGNEWFEVYDPYHDRLLRFGSAGTLRAWLDRLPD